MTTSEPLLQRTIQEHVIPGVLLRVMETGVLISGESGTGKSEAALGLLERGHQLVADDAVCIGRTPTGIHGSCPAELADRLEVRGLGILAVTTLFGAHQLVSVTEINLIIRLVRPTHDAWAAWPRLEGCWDSAMILDTAIPQLTLPVARGRPLPLLVEATVRAFHATPREALND